MMPRAFLRCRSNSHVGEISIIDGYVGFVYTRFTINSDSDSLPAKNYCPLWHGSFVINIDTAVCLLFKVCQIYAHQRRLEQHQAAFAIDK